MKDNFDDKIKHVLENFEVAFTPDDWQAMESRMEQEPDFATEGGTPEDFNFDQQLKNTLTELNSTPYTPGAWDTFQAKLDTAELFDPEEDGHLSPLEQQVKATLTQLSVPYQATAWDAMEAKMDLVDNLEELDEVDSLVYDKLSSIHPPYSEKSWTVLSEKLDEEFSFRKRVIYRYKIAEVALLLLFVFTLFNLYPSFQHQWNTAKTKEHTPEMVQPAPIVPITQQTPTANTSQSTGSTIALATDGQPNVPTNTSSSIPTLPTAASIETQMASIAFQTPLVFQPKASAIAASTKAPIKNGTQLLPLKNALSIQIGSTTPSLYKKTGLILDLENLPISSLTPFDINNSSHELMAFNPPLPKQQLLKKFGFFVLGDYNYIMTPHDKDFDLESYAHVALGYGAGFSMGLSLGNWEVETGAVYAQKNYLPRNGEISGNILEGYDNNSFEISLDLLRIPLGVRYNINDKWSNWNIYTTVGAALNVAMTIDYMFDDIGFNSNAERYASTIRASYYDNKSFSEGYLNDDDFLTNSYYTATIGLGVEHQMTKHWSVFLQNNYQHTLPFNGLGPNKDRYNTISVLIGTRATLRNKK